MIQKGDNIMKHRAIDWNFFNWPEIFGTIHAIAPMMTNNQHKFMISDIIEPLFPVSWECLDILKDCMPTLIEVV